MKQEIYIFRHGESDYNAENRIQGRLDIPLNKTGTRQAKKLAKILSTINFDCIYTSPLSRALQTATMVAKPKNTKIIVKDGLRERGFGDFSGKTLRILDLPKDFPINTNHEIINIPLSLIKDANYIPPNGESYNMFRQRVYDIMNEILQNNKEAKTIGISTHGGVIGIFIKEYANLSLPRGGVPNAEYVKLEYDGQKFTMPEPPHWTIQNNFTKILNKILTSMHIK